MSWLSVASDSEVGPAACPVVCLDSSVGIPELAVVMRMLQVTYCKETWYGVTSKKARLVCPRDDNFLNS